jgi:hypothetical protein
MRFHIVALGLCLAMPGPLAGQATPDSLILNCGISPGSTACIYDTSIIQLLARPEVFDGRRVRVVGYIHFEFEGNGLYIHREDEKLNLLRNGVWVDFKQGAAITGSCQDQYVVVEGTFNARNHGHLGLWGGAITDITRCAPWG